MENNQTKSNYQYICDNYVLPKWFNHCDIDLLRYYPMKDGKMYKRNTKRTIEKMIKEEKKRIHNLTYIYDDEKVNIHEIFVNYLAYLNNVELDNYITNEEILKLLTIKVCDYDWTFMLSEPKYDKNSKELLLRNKTDKNGDDKIDNNNKFLDSFDDTEFLKIVNLFNNY
jgi:hypothetical protein